MRLSFAGPDFMLCLFPLCIASALIWAARKSRAWFSTPTARKWSASAFPRSASTATSIFSAASKFGQIFHIYGAEVTKTGMKGDLSKGYALQLQAFHDLPAEMHPRCGSNNSALMFGVNCLITLFIFRCSRAVMYFG